MSPYKIVTWQVFIDSSFSFQCHLKRWELALIQCSQPRVPQPQTAKRMQWTGGVNTESVLCNFHRFPTGYSAERSITCGRLFISGVAASWLKCRPPFVLICAQGSGGARLARGSQWELEFPLLLHARGDLVQQILAVQRAMHLGLFWQSKSNIVELSIFSYTENFLPNTFCKQL